MKPREAFMCNPFLFGFAEPIKELAPAGSERAGDLSAGTPAKAAPFTSWARADKTKATHVRRETTDDE